MIADVYYIRTPGAGSPASPCARKCRHGNCARFRWIASLECQLCHEPAGYDRPLFTSKHGPDGDIRAVQHVECAMAAVSKAFKLKTCPMCGK